MAFLAHLETPRLALRPLSLRDVWFYAALHRNPQVRQFPGGPVPWRGLFARFQQDRSPPPQTGIWVITLRQQPRAIGIVTLNPHKDGQDHEISYQFHPNAWGIGYAVEATTEVLRYAFADAALPRVIAETQAANQASCQLLERLAMDEVDRVNRFNAEQIIYAKTAPQ